MSTPDNCISCFSESCNHHGQLHSSHEFPEPYEIPISTEDPDGKDGANTSGEFPAALQSSFFDESESETDSSSDEEDETPEVGPASSASESEENEIDEPEIENAGIQYPRVLRGRLNHRVPRGRL